MITPVRADDRRRSLRFSPSAGAATSLAAGIAIILGSLQLPVSQTADVGEGRLPLLIGIIIVALSLAYAARTFVDQSGTDFVMIRSRANVAILLSLLIGYCAAIPLIGMVAATGIFMLIVMTWLSGWSHWLRSVAVTLTFLMLIYALFTWVIATPLP